MVIEKFVEHESKNMLRVGLTFDPIVEFVTKRVAQVAFNFRKLFYTSIMGHQHILVLKWVAVALAHITYAGSTNMGNQAIRLDLWCQIPQVSVTPGRIYRYKRDGFIVQLRHIPANTEPVPVEGLFNFAGMKTLVD